MELSGSDHNALRSICSQLHYHLSAAIVTRGLAVSELLINHASAPQQLMPFISAVALATADEDGELELQVDFKATDATAAMAASSGTKDKDKV